MKHEYVRAMIKVPEEVIEIGIKAYEEKFDSFTTSILVDGLSKEITKHEHIIEKEIVRDYRINSTKIHFGLMIVNPKEWKKMLEELGMYKELVAEINSKETPVKPTHVHDDIYSCPECAVAFRLPKNRFVHYQYCDVCGQKFDWSEDNEDE